MPGCQGGGLIDQPASALNEAQPQARERSRTTNRPREIFALVRIFPRRRRLIPVTGPGKALPTNHPSTNMKMIRHTLLAAFAASLAWFAPADRAAAADVTLDGSGFYETKRKVEFRGKGVKQTGRYGNFGPDYYRGTKYGMRWITNRSNKKTRKLSFEFWGMPFYGATEGVVLMTRQVKPIKAGRTLGKVRREGRALYLDEFRFPELNIWEFRGNGGWNFRDALSFKRRTVL
jgi:hypothetical protein